MEMEHQSFHQESLANFKLAWYERDASKAYAFKHIWAKFQEQNSFSTETWFSMSRSQVPATKHDSLVLSQ